MKSPVTSSNNVLLLEKIDRASLASLYKESLDLEINIKELPETIELYKCLDTNLLFFYPESSAGDGEFYKDLEKISWYYQENRWEFNKVIKTLTSNAKLLEIGCGKLAFLKRLKEQRPDVEGVGIELNDNAVEYGKKEGFRIENKMIKDFSLENKGLFDVVCCFQVLEHISDVKEFINSSLACLKPGGTFILTVPNNDSIFFKIKTHLPKDHPKYINHLCTLALNMPPHHMGLWTEESINALTKHFPMTLAKIEKEKAEEGRVNLINAILLNKYSWIKAFPWLQKPIYFKLLNKNYETGDSLLAYFVKK
jgi:2-polyprenyl-3-methyl-5-hydroxy-6-metoxy-1,4-benzoquinol methylase